MALFNSRKRLQSSQPVPVEVVSPAPEPTAPPVQASAAPLGAGLRLISAPVPEAPVIPLAAARPESEEPRAEDLRGLPLGTILYRRGLVEQSELEEALAAGMESGERLGEVLIGRGLVAEEEIGRCLALQQGLTFLSEEELVVDPAVAALIPAAEAHELGAVAVSVQDGVLLVVSPDPSAHQRGRLAVVLGREVDEAVVSRAVFASLVERVKSGVDELQPSAAASAPDAEEHAQSGSPVGAEEPVAGPQPDVPWLVAEEAPEQAWTAVAAETHQPDFKEEHQMEHSWTSDDSGESDEPSAWSEPSDDAGSGHGYASEFAGLAQPEQEHEQERWDADQAPVVAHLAPVVDESDAEETTEEWVEPADRGEQGRWADHAEEAPAEEHSWNGASSPEPGPVAEHESAQNPVVQAVAPDAGRIDELGAQHEASVGRIDELLVRIHEGATTYSDLRARIGALTENLQTTEQALADREQRLGALGEEHSSAQRRIDELVSELQERDDALSGLGQRLEDLTGRLGSAEARLDEREQRLAELDASLGERVRHIEELSAQVERRDHALSAFEEKLAAIAAQFVADGAA